MTYEQANYLVAREEATPIPLKSETMGRPIIKVYINVNTQMYMWQIYMLQVKEKGKSHASAFALFCFLQIICPQYMGHEMGSGTLMATMHRALGKHASSET